jgi:gas vesicle protein
MTFKLSSYLPFKSKDGKDISPTDIPDITSDVIDNLRGVLPSRALEILDIHIDNVNDATHQLKCQLDIEAKKGQALQCARGKQATAIQNKVNQNNYTNRPKKLKTGSRTIKPTKERGITTKKTNFNKTRLNQNQLDNNYQDANITYKVDPSKFADNYDPNKSDSTLGNRAVLFDSNGKVLRTANEINREGKAIDESAKLATISKVRSTDAKTRAKRELRTLNKAIDKMKGQGEINSLASLFAAITGMVAVIALLAVLVPLSFITVALNWLQTITTMIANIKDLATTYLSITDAGLALFGYPKATNKLKAYVNDIAYGLFGKENFEQSKAAFAQGILNLTSLTKMLERVESARRSINGGIEGLKFSLGTANNALKDAGLIPPDSPWMEYSEKVGKFADTAQSETKDNIQKLTEEIQTQEEVNAEIAQEASAKAEIKAKKQKEVDSLKQLGSDLKPLVEKQIAAAQE